MRISYQDNSLFLETEGGRREVHPMWLRERVSGDEHICKQTQQRLYQPSDLPLEMGILHASVADDGETCTITFTDGLSANFHTDDLHEDVFHTQEWHPRMLQRWKGDTKDTPNHSWTAIKQSDAALWRMLDDFYRFGFVIVEDTPKEKGFMHDFVGKFGEIRGTHFGTIFDVENKPVYNDLAYTALGLTAHNDNNYRYHVPGIQVLHSIANEVDGGLSTLVNGVSIAEEIRATDPAAFHALSTVKPRFRFMDADAYLWGKGSLIELDDAGEIFQIRYSNRVEYVPLLPKEELDTYYRARQRFCNMLNGDTYCLKFRLQAGSLMMMDNHRILHGRTGFDPSQGYRLLQGAYIDHDWPLDKWNFLQRQPEIVAQLAA